MTARQQKAVQRYVDRLRPMLGLSDWQVNVRRDPTKDDSHIATIWPVFGCRSANVRFATNFFEMTPEHQRETIVHELLHCVFAVTQHQVEIGLADHMEAPVHSLFHELWSHAHEYAVDSLAVALGPRLPLPELP